MAGKDETYAVMSDLCLSQLSSQWKSKAVLRRFSRRTSNSTGSEIAPGAGGEKMGGFRRHLGKQ